MFRLSDFLIYCFITAYSPGANNLLSMSNAMRLGFSRSIRFNFGITALYDIQCSPLLSSAKRKNRHAGFRSCLYAVSRMEGLEKHRRFE